MRAAIDSFAGAQCISLFVRPDNEPALRLYAQLGFSKWQRVNRYYSDGMFGVLAVRWRPLAANLAS